jgi:hypothetical protein
MKMEEIGQFSNRYFFCKGLWVEVARNVQLRANRERKLLFFVPFCLIWRDLSC